MPLTKSVVKFGAGPVVAPAKFQAAIKGSPVTFGLTADSIYESILEIADFLEQDGPVIADLARTSLSAFQAFVNKDFSGIVSALGHASADFMKIAADLRALVNS